MHTGLWVLVIFTSMILRSEGEIREIEFDCENRLGGSVGASFQHYRYKANQAIDDSVSTAWGSGGCRGKDWYYEFATVKKITRVDLRLQISENSGTDPVDISIQTESAENPRSTLVSRRLEVEDGRERLIRFDIPAGRADFFKKYIVEVDKALTRIYNIQMFEELDRDPNPANYIAQKQTSWIQDSIVVPYKKAHLYKSRSSIWSDSILETKRDCFGEWQPAWISFEFLREEVVDAFAFESAPGEEPTNFALYQSNERCDETNSLKLLATFDQNNATDTYKFNNVEPSRFYCFKTYNVSGYSVSTAHGKQTFQETVLLKNVRFMKTRSTGIQTTTSGTTTSGTTTSGTTTSGSTTGATTSVGREDLVLKEVAFMGGSAGSSSLYGSKHLPENAFKRNSDFWHSGRDSEGKSDLVVPMPHLIWYSFQTPFVPGRVSFKPRQGSACGDKGFWCGATEWQFIGTNDDNCDQNSAWTVLCEDRSGKPFQSAGQTKYCRVNDNIKKKFKCLGISVLNSSFTGSEGFARVSINGIRMWERVFQ